MRKNRAFTLVELLVVIGIIALLISVLLPALGGARRSANAVKCLANLRQVGTAFQFYAGDFKGAIPVVRQDLPDNGTIIVNSRNVWWQDQVGPYVAKAKFNSATVADLSEAQLSVVWGCTEWTGRINSASVVSQYDTGYGMNPQLSHRPDYPSPGTAPLPGNEFAMRWADVYYGKYYRMAQIKHSTERVLVADGMLWVLNARPSDGSGPNGLPGQYLDANQINASSSSMAGLMDYDLLRHAKKPGKTVTKGSGTFFDISSGAKIATNAVFFDGHAETLTSITDAYRAIFLKNP